MANDIAELYSAIAGQTSDKTLQQALLLGSYGESSWYKNASGTGGGGFFGFTPPNYPAWLETASPSQQVSAIIGSYQQAESKLPSGITGSAAAEWIALNAERPANYNTRFLSAIYPYVNPAIPGLGESENIQQTNAPTQYGANQSVNQATITQSVWPQIVSVTGQGATSVSPNGQIGQTIPQADALAAASTFDYYTDPKSTTGFGKQASAALTQTMNPLIKKNNVGSGWLQDAIGILTLGTAGTNPVKVLENVAGTDAEVASAISGDPIANIWRTVTAGLVRVGIAIIGILLVAGGIYIIVHQATGGATPVPIPV
jgi:hypothetical protein